MDLDSNSVRMFEVAYELGSFSKAAKALKVSQPSISQMIARLESKLGNLLFERVGHSIVPTQLAQELHQFASGWLDSLDTFWNQFQEMTLAPKGLVRFAKPESCLWTDHYQVILRQLASLKEIRIDIGIATNQEIVEGVLRDKYDFGFIVGERVSPDLRFEKFSEEEYVAVHATSVKGRSLFDGKSSVRIVTYPGWEHYFDIWAASHRIPKGVRNSKLVPVVNVGNIAGAIEAVVQGAGITILPAQCVKAELRRRQVNVADPSSVRAKSPVYLVKRRNYIPPVRVKVILDKLKETIV